MMGNLSGQGGELRMVVEVTRKATGKVETVELVGKLTQDEAEKLGLAGEKEDGGNS